MESIIPQNYVQCAFDFDALSDQPVDDVFLPINPVPLQKKFCPRCEQWLDATSEYWSRKGGSQPGFRVPCKACRHDDYLAHPERGKAMTQKRREAFLAKSPEEQEQIRARQNKQYRDRSAKIRQTGMCGRCLARPAASGRFVCDQCYAYRKQYGDELGEQVLAVYGGVCVQCGETHPAFLSVDHVENDGAEHRRLTGGGYRLYLWLRKNGFPQEGFQLLCANCNWLKYVSLKSGEKNYMQLWYAHLRQEVLAAYGGMCACCGENRPEVLTVDHVKNDGAQHRRQVGAGSRLYAWLRKNGFPKEGFQILCFNCNRARYFHEVCPHQQ